MKSTTVEVTVPFRSSRTRTIQLVNEVELSDTIDWYYKPEVVVTSKSGKEIRFCAEDLSPRNLERVQQVFECGVDSAVSDAVGPGEPPVEKEPYEWDDVDNINHDPDYGM